MLFFFSLKEKAPPPNRMFQVRFFSLFLDQLDENPEYESFPKLKGFCEKVNPKNEDVCIAQLEESSLEYMLSLTISHNQVLNIVNILFYI